jgi:hypothetical protein
MDENRFNLPWLSLYYIESVLSIQILASDKGMELGLDSKAPRRWHSWGSC